MKRSPGPARSTSVARPAITLVSHQRWWPFTRAFPGLANGWQGSAWVAFKLAGAGMPVPDRVFESIGRRLAVELGRAPRTRHIGALIGCAGDVVVAAYAAQQGRARGALARAACQRVLRACENNPAWDVHLGVGGALLAFAEVAAVEPDALRDLRPGRLVSRLVASMEALCKGPPVGWPTGMAHGLAGAIMAVESCRALGWCRITTRQRQRWLDTLCRCAVAVENGALLWPRIAGQTDLGLQSWCAGTPGVALALLECFRLTEEPAYLEFARGALEGMTVLANRVFLSDTLCCGDAGYRHIFLEAYRITAEPAWLEHARRKVRFSTTVRPRVRRCLYQGELGIAYLAERMANPVAYPFPALGASSA